MTLVSACATTGVRSIPPSVGATQVGLATYYSDRLAGHPTASGEPYEPSALTAAHRSLPLGTVVNVQRTDTAGSVTVRVNDRGPYAGPSRIIDLSHAAAAVLGMLRAGVVPVRLTVLSVGHR